jgi:hypothetical protein
MVEIIVSNERSDDDVIDSFARVMVSIALMAKDKDK